jgi:hypothetical protein
VVVLGNILLLAYTALGVVGSNMVDAYSNVVLDELLELALGSSQHVASIFYVDRLAVDNILVEVAGNNFLQLSLQHSKHLTQTLPLT